MSCDGRQGRVEMNGRVAIERRRGEELLSCNLDHSDGQTGSMRCGWWKQKVCKMDCAPLVR
jgi:hypothetical protein